LSISCSRRSGGSSKALSSPLFINYRQSLLKKSTKLSRIKSQASALLKTISTSSVNL